MLSDSRADDTAVSRIITMAFAGLTFLLTAVLLVWTFAQGRFLLFIILAVMLGLTLWTFFARDRWWILLPTVVSFGGFFYFGFKIRVEEMGLLLALLPLLISVAIAPHAIRVRRPALSPTAYFLFAYLVSHLVGSVFLARAQGLSGIGTIVRMYFRGLWPLAFVIAFNLYGNTRHLRAGLIAMYIASLSRVALGVMSFIFPRTLYIPGINFVLPTATLGATDLRASSLLFVSFSICFVGIVRNRVGKGIHFLFAVAAIILVLLGAGRAGFLMFCVIPLFLLFIRRHYILLGAAGGLLLLVSAYLNFQPEVLYRLPAPARRTLSVLVLEAPHHNVHAELRLSNLWHFELAREGRRRWLSSVRSFIIGNRVYPFRQDYNAHTASFHSQLQIAADLGSYEAGLWTLLACTGTVSAILYLWLFLHLWTGPLKALRQHGIQDYAHAYYFLSLTRGLTWIVFCWIAGHFPGDELMFGGIAKAVHDDQQARDSESKDTLGANG